MLLGPGFFGFSFILEALMAVFLLHVFHPQFPYVRILEKGLLILLIIAFFDFLGPHYGARMLEAIWQFILRDVATVLGV